MTNTEFRYYSNKAINIFNYMNGRINIINNFCYLDIGYYDFLQNTYANIRYPNNITIHIGTIVDSWNDNWSNIMTKSDYVCTCIAWALAHELHHADQLISMVNYNANIDYKNKVEGDVERKSYDWVFNHSRELHDIGGFNVVIHNLESPTLPESGSYTKASVKEFYLQTIANIILRDFDLFNNLKVFSDNYDTNSIILNFNNMDFVQIKNNGEYIPYNINYFSQLVYKWAGDFDIYKVSASSYVDSNKNATVVFNISEAYKNALVFKK